MVDLKFDSRKRRRVKTCPCGKSNRDGKFVPYQGHEEFGYCHSCGESFFPKTGTRPEKKIHFPEPPKPIHMIPDHFLVEAAGQDNNFTDFLFSRFDMAAVGRAVKLYEIGTWQESFGWPYWTDAVCFWQIDFKGRIRQVKAMRYDPASGKRIQPDGSYLLGRKLLEGLNIKEPNLKQCFFGEHLLPEFPDYPVGLVESDKTAVICSIVIPEILWLATGGSNGCKWYEPDVFKVIQGRRVVLYPDNNMIDQWTEKIEETKLDRIAKISICRDFHTRMGPGEEKDDIADYLLAMRLTKPI
jgi:hypothetical protein